MNDLYEQLARQFEQTPIHIYGVYRTELEAGGIYRGHVDRPTSKCAMVAVLRGEAAFIFNETERYDVSPGKVLMGGAGRRLELEVGSAGLAYFLVHYYPAYPDMPEAGRLMELSVLNASVDPHMLELQEQLLQAASIPGSMGELAKRTLFYRLLYEMLQSERRHQNEESYPAMEDAISYIRSHYMDPITLESLAGRYQMKAKYFSYLFHKYVGISPIDYLIRQRMDRAYEWLMTGQFSVAAVARSVGYSDPYYFSRLFKKHKGVPPSSVAPCDMRNNPS